MKWDTLSFILSSDKRVKIIKSLQYPKTPTMISKETGVSKEHVSRVLKKFQRMGLVECKTPNKLKGKIFVITTMGKGILRHIDKI